MKKHHYVFAALSSVLVAGSASAYDLTANAGFVSEYVFRGLPQTDGNAAAQGGLDISEGNFSLGTWASTVKSTPSIDASDPSNPVLVSGDNGLEIDFYGAYSNSYKEIDYSIGFTLYTYTDDFDDEYREINLSGGWKWFTLDFAVGEWDAFSAPTQDYHFTSLTGELNGFYATYGDFSDDFSGSYFELGYGSTLSVAGEDLFDYSISYVDSDDELANDSYLLFGIVKNFEITSN